MKKKKQLVSEQYIKLLEMMGDTPFDVTQYPETLFTGEELDEIEDIRRRMFYSLYSKVCIFVEPSEFDFSKKRSCILFCIMARQLQLYAPESDEYVQVTRILRSIPRKYRVEWN